LGAVTQSTGSSVIRAPTQVNMRKKSRSQQLRPHEKVLKDVVCLYCRARRSVSTGCTSPCPLTTYLPEDQTAGSRLPPGTDGRVLKLINLFNQDWRSRLTIAQLAAALDLSASHLSRLFKRETGLPIQTFLRIRRLWQAARLLTISDDRVSQVCFSVGFSDPANFDRLFSGQFGMSPSEYRRFVRAKLLSAGRIPAPNDMQGFTKE
jgi:AraC-like DNA-binding protein